MESNPNQITDLKYRKFPVNWLPEEFAIIEKIAKSEFFGVKAQYIRRAVQKDLRARGLIGPNAQTELFPEYTPIQVEKRKIGLFWKNKPANTPVKEPRMYVDPPRRYSGSYAGLFRNIGVASWYAKKKQDYREYNK